MYDLSKLYLQLDADQATEQALRGLAGQFSLPAILLNVGATPASDIESLTRIVQTVQDLDAAALIEDDAELAKACRADGVHLSDTPEQINNYEIARRVLNSDSIVGANIGLSRHLAMAIGEVGADYVAFDAHALLPEQNSDEDHQVDLVSWWAEVFEIPCVAMDDDHPERVRQLADAGADFIGLRGDMSAGAESLHKQILSFARLVAPTSDQATANE